MDDPGFGMLVQCVSVDAASCFDRQHLYCRQCRMDLKDKIIAAMKEFLAE